MTKAKPFFEVFPSLELKGTLHDKLEQTAVERVSATKQKDRLSVYLFSTRLLPKEDIWAAEKAIKSQLFPHAFLTVRIFERFELSAQYTPENLMEAYRESILAELKEYSHVEYNAFRTAQITYPESGRIRLTIDDTVLNHSKEPELIRVLEKILVERCGLTAGVEVGYREAESGRFAEDDELRLQMKVNEIFLRAKACGAYGEGQSGQTAPGGGSANGRGGPGGDRRGAKGDAKSGGFPAGGAAKGNGFVPGERNGDGGNGFGGRADAPGDGSGNGKKAFRGDFKRGEFRRGDRPLKQSDNPDVIYGKDFEEEPIPIDEIIGEVGDVTIRGKVLKTDSREIRNERTIVIFDVTDFTDTMTVKLFTKTEFVKELLGSLKPGTFVKLKGVATLDKFDHELTIGSLTGIKKIPNFVKVRSDTAAHKRVEQTEDRKSVV